MLCAHRSHTCARTMGLEWVKDVHSHIQARLEKDALLVMRFYTCMHSIHSSLQRCLYRVSSNQYILSTDGFGGIHQHHISCEFRNPRILLLTILICCCAIFYWCFLLS
ncbi:hypothetical protein KC19_VG289100 [Ceratodon purpureus]|uniref:Uncharacterized protein n=1 Tax=Ceratodon purpureus TaxID=3225 RepID=A0A8T0HVP6_CERPU|nr:hypothetical protein KC19_VG289100 [Ceratodon purpureus]